MPWVLLIAHEAFLQRPLFQVPDEVSIATLALLCAAAPSPCPVRTLIRPWHVLAGWRVVRWARLQANWLTGIEVACDALDSCWDTALLLVHS